MTKGRIISISRLYLTIELLEPTSLQQGQIVTLQAAQEQPAKLIEEHWEGTKILKASVTRANQADLLQKGDSLLYERHESSGNSSLSTPELPKYGHTSSHNENE